MELWVLGANGTYTTAGRPTAGYLLRHEGTTLWLEAGSGTLLALQELMDPADVDAVVISHRHSDHAIDIFMFRHYLSFGFESSRPVPLFVPEGLADLLAGFGGSEMESTFTINTPGVDEEVAVGSMDLRFGRANHTVPTLQLRVEAGGRALAYSADTGIGSDLVGLAAGCNTLLCEASFQGKQKPVPHHLTAAEAAEIAREAGVERLILTHLRPTLDPQRSIEEAAAVFGGDIVVAAPGLEVLI